MTNRRPRLSVILGLLIVVLGLFWNDIRERIPDVVPPTPPIDIVDPDEDAIERVSHIAASITDNKDRVNLCIFNKIFANRLLSYPTDAQQINDVYVLAAKDVFGSSLKGKYSSLGQSLTDLMRSVTSDDNHTLSTEEKEELSRYFMALAWCLEN